MSGVEPIPVREIVEGRVAWIFPDDFDVDLIIGVEHIKVYDPDRLRQVCMASYEPEFASLVRPGDVIVGGRNFGYGHPHYPAMMSMRALGIAAVVAESFTPGFRRGETFNGMLLVTCPGIAQAVQRWDSLRLRWQEGIVENTTTGVTIEGIAPSRRTIDILEAGGTEALLLREHRARTADETKEDA